MEISEAIGLFLAGGVVTFIVTASFVWVPRIRQLQKDRDYWRTEAAYNDDRDKDTDALRILWDK